MRSYSMTQAQDMSRPMDMLDRLSSGWKAWLILFAITFNQQRELQPLPAGLFEFIGYQDVTWNQMMAAALTGILPVMVIFLFLQKYLVAGLTAGAVKE